MARRKAKRDDDVWTRKGKPLEGADAEFVTTSRLEGDPWDLLFRILRGSPVKTKDVKVPRAVLTPGPPPDAKVVDATQPETLDLFDPGVPPSVETLETIARSMHAQRLIDRRMPRPCSVNGGKAGKGKTKYDHNLLIRRIVVDVGAGPDDLDTVLDQLRDDSFFGWERFTASPSRLKVTNVYVDDMTKQVIFEYSDGERKTVGFGGLKKAIKRGLVSK